MVPGSYIQGRMAIPSVLKTKKEGQILVAFFGDNSCGWFDPKELKPFDPHYAETAKRTKLPAFLEAVEDAEDEVSRKAALGLACWCHNLLWMRPINYFDWFYAVDIEGHGSSGVYLMKQIKRTRNEFQPVVALSFLRQLALIPSGKVQRYVDWIKNVAVICAYRKAVFEEIDETRVLSSGDQSENYNYSTIDIEQLHEDISFQVPQSRPIEVSEAVGQTKKLASLVELTDQFEGETCSSKQYEKGGCTSCDMEVESQGSKTHQYEILKDGTHESLKINSIDESGQIILSDEGNSLTSQQQRENKANHTLSSDSMDYRQVLRSVRTEAELCHIYADMLTLALNPYHGVEQNISSTVEKFVLQFRSIFYQKSRVANLSVERELGEVKCKSSDFSASTVPVQSPLSSRALSLPLDSIPPKKRLMTLWLSNDLSAKQYP